MLFDDLELIPLDLPQTGFHQFISTWLLNCDGDYVIIDPGPSATIPYLIEQLKKREIHQLEGILLTHIHLDHAGGVSDLIKEIPTNWIQCHEKAIPHLIDPTNLWKGSLKVLGELAKLYGEMKPVPASLLQSEKEIVVNSTTIKVVDTPGHAPHHQSFIAKSYLFVGEAGGLYHATSGSPYRRPATPPRFKKDVFLDSILRLIKHPDLPDTICYGHFGYSDDAREQLTLAFHQLDNWNDTIFQMNDLSNEEIFRFLLQTDPLLTSFYNLPPDQQEREQYFINNTLNGIRLSFKN